MSLYWVALAVGAVFLTAYFTYGRFLSAQFGLEDSRRTPAEELNDGVDYVPAKKGFLLGQHFSAIAAAGPIVGPILAGLWFGWLPVLLWIVFGAVFFGAVHDFSSLAGSVRHRAVSIVELVRTYLGPRGHFLFLLFVWFSLIYVITAFTDLTSGSFVDAELGGSVASSSLLYLFLGIAMGLALKRGMPLGPATALFLTLVLVSIAAGPSFPLRFPEGLFVDPKMAWNVVLLAYCFVASLVPVWILLQPRGYLGGFFLYATLAVGVVGLFLGGEKILYPAFTGFTSPAGLTLFPALFVTVACGACSGFHGIVCSGTTSKQISRETDCRLVGYGGMLLEGFVALIALSTVMILAKGDALASGGAPDRVYAEGLSRFVSHFGIPREFARSFALLAFTTFIYDTLDVATRLARYIFQELTGWKSTWGKVAATLASLALPLLCVSLRMTDSAGRAIPAWKVFWTLFGTSNQLLAGLTLMILSLWLRRAGKSWWVSFVPMVFMLSMTAWSLIVLMRPLGTLFAPGGRLDPIAGVSALLFVLAVLLAVEAVRSLRSKPLRSE